MFNYLKNNLAKIENPDNVNVIIPEKDEKGKRALFAIMNGGEKIQLTSSLGTLSFPFEPIGMLRNVLGEFYLSNYAVIENYIAINKAHLTSLFFVDKNEKRVKTFAGFDDGRVVELCNPTRNFFFKGFKSKIEQACEMKFDEITKPVNTEDVVAPNDEFLK